MYWGSPGANGVAAITGGNTFFVPTGGSGGNLTVPADTNEDTLVTVNIPPLTANAVIRVSMQWSCTNNANVKTARVRLSGGAGTIFLSYPLTSSLGTYTQGQIQNVGATNVQRGGPTGNPSAGGFGTNGADVVTGAVDTSVATTLVITGQKATSGDSMVLQAYLVEVLKP